VSLHQLSGLGRPEFPGPLRGLLQGLGVLGKLEFVEMENLFRFIAPDRVDLTLPADRAGVLQVLKGRFPDEKDGIERFFDLVYRFFHEVIGAFYLRDPEVTPEKYPLYFQYAFRDSQGVLDEYFRDPYLKLTIAAYWGYMGLPPRLLSFTDLASLLFAYIEFKPWHLKGGSQALSNALAAAALAAGGEIRFSCAATRIVTENGAVRAVVTDRGEEITTRYVISNASAVATFAGLLDDGEGRTEALNEVRGAVVGTSFLTVYAGLRCPPEAVSISETTNFICNSPDFDRDFALCRTLDVSEPPLIMSCYDVSDPTFSPEGTCQAAIVTMKYAEPWLRVPPEEYAAEKYRSAEVILRRIERHFPRFTANIEEMEVATPITHMRYLGHPGGSPYGFEQHVKDSTLFRNPKPPVKGLFGAGAWYGMPGYQPTLTSGAAAARAVLREMSRKEGTR
jgi:phytoene dehydrogenase-like protein